MSTQEKLEQKIFNLVYQWGRVGIVADHTAPTYVAYIQELIDSAKREGAIEFAKKADQALDGLNIDIETTEKHIRKVFGHDERLAKRRLYEVTTEAEDRADIIDECRYAIAQLEQSEESE